MEQSMNPSVPSDPQPVDPSPAAPLSVDPLWRRAGGWPTPEHVAGPLDAAVLGIGAHLTSLTPTGAHATPAAIRQALARYSPALVTQGRLLDLAQLRVVDAGDVPDPDSTQGEQRSSELVAELAARAGLVIALGGDNSLTYAVARGSGARALITVDAHHDLRDGVSNGSPVQRLVSDALIEGPAIIQIGIADFANSIEYARRAQQHGITVIGLDQVRRDGIESAINAARTVIGDRPTHLDIDVDVCDRSVAPGCPASVPGGLAAWELRALVRGLAELPSVVSADVAEVDATADTPDQRTVRLAALCVLELLAGLAART